MFALVLGGGSSAGTGWETGVLRAAPGRAVDVDFAALQDRWAQAAGGARSAARVAALLD